MGIGLGYIALAKKEKHLFDLLYLSGRVLLDFENNIFPIDKGLLLEIMQKNPYLKLLPEEDLLDLLCHMWIYTHGLTVLTRTNPSISEAFVQKALNEMGGLIIKNKLMKKGCLGCCTCGYDNTCIQRDDFSQFFNSHLKTADIIIIAGTIRDHYLSSTWKKFFDRSFFNGHAPVLMDKRLGFIISGPLSQIQNLREILEVFGDNWHMKSAGLVTDEHRTSEEITTHIRAFASELKLTDEQNLEFGDRFYRVGGQKIFRDFIFNTSAVFRADHLFYKKMGVYQDFPQRKIKKRISNAIFSIFVAIKPMRKKIHQKFIQGMVAPYKKVLRKLSSR
jgi:multimeric flavodoxin WrbA